MKSLRLLICAVALAVSMGLITPALAQSGCSPGEMMGPPCASVQIVNEDVNDPGIVQIPPAAETVDLVSVATDVLTGLLLF